MDPLVSTSIQVKERENDDVIEEEKNINILRWLGICGVALLITTFVALQLMGISVSSIGRCSKHGTQNLRVWIIVWNCSNLLLIVDLLWEWKKAITGSYERDPRRNDSDSFIIIMSLFIAAWFFVGNLWIYKFDMTYEDCDRYVYNYVLYTIAVYWCLIGIGMTVFSIWDDCCGPCCPDSERSPYTITHIIFSVAMKIVLCIIYCASIVIGSIGECEKHGTQNIKAWLIVFGAGGSLIIGVSKWAEIDSYSRIMHSPNGPLSAGVYVSLIMGMLVWLVVGNIWVYNYDVGPDYQECDMLTFTFVKLVVPMMGPTTLILLILHIFFVCGDK